VQRAENLVCDHFGPSALAQLCSQPMAEVTAHEGHGLSARSTPARDRARPANPKLTSQWLCGGPLLVPRRGLPKMLAHGFGLGHRGRISAFFLVPERRQHGFLRIFPLDFFTVVKKTKGVRKSIEKVNDCITR
jgi:hypothetical protein